MVGLPLVVDLSCLLSLPFVWWQHKYKCSVDRCNLRGEVFFTLPNQYRQRAFYWSVCPAARARVKTVKERTFRETQILTSANIGWVVYPKEKDAWSSPISLLHLIFFSASFSSSFSSQGRLWKDQHFSLVSSHLSWWCCAWRLKFGKTPSFLSFFPLFLSLSFL